METELEKEHAFSSQFSLSQAVMISEEDMVKLNNEKWKLNIVY